MFRLPRNTGVPGFRVGLPEDPPGFAVDDYPYGDATLASGDPRGVGTERPDFLGSRPWPARPQPLETVPRPDLGPYLAPPPPPPPPWPPFPSLPPWPDDKDPMRKLPPPPPHFYWWLPRKPEPKPAPQPTLRRGYT